MLVAREPFHAGNQVSAGSLDYQMKMIGHRTQGVDLPTGLAAGFAQGFKELLPVGVVAEDGFPATSRVHYMINRAWIFHSQFAGHCSTVPDSSRYVNIKN